MEKEVFISYAWGDKSEKGESREDIVDYLENMLKTKFVGKNISIVRDKNDLQYGKKIKEFMERIGKGKYVIIVLSDKYLKSENCMYEVYQLKQNNLLYTSAFFIILDDATAIYNSHRRNEYIDYWSERIKVQQKNLHAKAPSTKHNLNLYRAFLEIIDEFITLAVDTNTLNEKIHKKTGFQELINEIEKRFIHHEKMNDKSYKQLHEIELQESRLGLIDSQIYKIKNDKEKKFLIDDLKPLHSRYSALREEVEVILSAISKSVDEEHVLKYNRRILEKENEISTIKEKINGIEEKLKLI